VYLRKINSSIKCTEVPFWGRIGPDGEPFEVPGGIVLTGQDKSYLVLEICTYLSVIKPVYLISSIKSFKKYLLKQINM
jgi:hypothetical protein